MFGLNKKEEKKAVVSDVPVQAVLSMKERGMSNEEIIEQLKSQGYSLQSIKDALVQADVKKKAVAPVSKELPPLPGSAPETKPAEEVTPVRAGPGLNPPPSEETYKPAPVKTTPDVNEIERILEEIVDERWKDVTGKFSSLETSRAKDETRINELDKRVTELARRLDEISSVVMTKVDEYKKTMEDVDVEIKALEKVMEKLVPSMTEQVKELKDVVGELKGVKSINP